VVLEAAQLAERDVPDYLESIIQDAAKYARIPHLSDVPFPVQMEPASDRRILLALISTPHCERAKQSSSIEAKNGLLRRFCSSQ